MDPAIEAQRLERERTAERLAAGEIVDPQLKARIAVAAVFNDEVGHRRCDGDEQQRRVTYADIYVVTFAYILGGWKAMLSSDAWDDTSYFEVTYNRAKSEMYVDHYRKVSNTQFSDDEFIAAALTETR